MIKNSTELIAAARNALQKMLERCVERGSHPSYTEMYHEGYAAGCCDAEGIEPEPKDPLADWHYIELEGNPPTDDRCVILVQCDGYTDIEKGWYDQDKDCYHMEYEPRGMHKVLAWHILPIYPEDYKQMQNG